jgi:molybdopterin-binding protein
MPRKEQGWITFQSSEEERQILEHYCKQSQRTKTEILRELVRSLEQPSTPASTQKSSDKRRHQDISVSSEIALSCQTIQHNGLKLSARNVLQGRVKQVIISPVNTEVTLEIVPGVDLVSVITTASAKKLNLCDGKIVYAVIKSNNVMLADP